MRKGRKSKSPQRRNSTRTQTQESPDRKKKKTDDNTKSPSKRKSNKTQTRKEKASDYIQEDDEMSVDTPKGNNKTDTFTDSTFTSFLYFRFKVTASKKGSETMRAKLQELYKIMQIADSDICLSHYKIDIEKDDKGNTMPISDRFVVETPEDISESITGMSKIFFGARPNSKGGNIWTNIRMLHTEPIENIIADTKEDFKELDASIGLQSIQHWDVGSIGFLQRMHPDVDVDNLHEYLSTALKKMHPEMDLKLGLKVKSPWDGKKRDTTKVVHFKDRIQAVHLQCEGKHTTITAKIIKAILISPIFQQRYNCDVRLIPEFDRNAGPYIQEKIRRCITQHSQFCKCVTSNTCEGIDHLDQKNKSLKKTLRQLILELPDAHFINIDLNWSNSGYAILYPKKYEEIAQERIANLGPYLHKTYGDAILSSLSIEMQESIHDCTWDEETGRPLTKLDRELDDILQSGEDLDYVDMTLITQENARPSDTISDTFIPQLDTNTISTFGTVKEKIKRTAGLSKTHDVNIDDKSILSGITLDSRMSKMEEEFSSMADMLKILVGRSNTGIAGTHPNTNQDAGGTVVSPAKGL